MTFEELNGQAQKFLEKLYSQLSENKIQIKEHWMIDHLCYRVDSQTYYKEQKVHFSQLGELLIESEVNGRLIATYKLHRPIEFSGRKIFLIELPAPKKGKITQNGFEHIEVVVDIPFDEIMANHPHCKFDQSGLSKSFNQELEIPLHGCAIKFHHLSLEDVIKIELSAQDNK